MCDPFHRIHTEHQAASVIFLDFHHHTYIFLHITAVAMQRIFYEETLQSALMQSNVHEAVHAKLKAVQHTTGYFIRTPRNVSLILAILRSADMATSNKNSWHIWNTAGQKNAHINHSL